MATESPFTQVFRAYFASETGIPSLKRFYERQKQFFLENSTTGNVRSTWVARFEFAAKEFNVEEWSNEQPSWEVILQQKLNEFRQSQLDTSSSLGSEARETDRQRSSPKVSGSSESAGTPASARMFKSMPLTHAQWEAYDTSFKAMEDTEKWKVQDIFVEDKIYEFGKKCTSEHAAHSFILDLGDPCWSTVFSKEELHEIRTHKTEEPEEVPPSLQDFLGQFKDKKTVDQIDETAEKNIFHAGREFDESWAKRAILELSSFYRWNVISRVGRLGREKDLVVRVWRNIDLCFDNLGIETQRGDQQSSASTARSNMYRRSPNGSILAKGRGLRPDLILAKNMIEYGAAETGYYDEGGVGVKEITEQNLKLPIIMKDMFVSICAELKNQESKVRQIEIIGYHHTHLRTTASVMDSPAGYICRIHRFPEHKVPFTVAGFYNGIIPFLETVWQTKRIVAKTIQLVEKGPEKGKSTSFATSSEVKSVNIPSVLMRCQVTTPRKRSKTGSEVVQPDPQ